MISNVKWVFIQCIRLRVALHAEKCVVKTIIDLVRSHQLMIISCCIIMSIGRVCPMCIELRTNLISKFGRPTSQAKHQCLFMISDVKWIFIQQIIKTPALITVEDAHLTICHVGISDHLISSINTKRRVRA